MQSSDKGTAWAPHSPAVLMLLKANRRVSVEIVLSVVETLKQSDNRQLACFEPQDAQKGYQSEQREVHSFLGDSQEVNTVCSLGEVDRHCSELKEI